MAWYILALLGGFALFFIGLSFVLREPRDKSKVKRLKEEMNDLKKEIEELKRKGE